MNSDQVGKFFTDKDGNIWQMVSFIENPSTTLKKVGTEESLHGAVGCSLFEDFNEVHPSQEEIIQQMLKQTKGILGDDNVDLNSLSSYEPPTCHHETLINNKCSECGKEFVPVIKERPRPYRRW